MIHSRTVNLIKHIILHNFIECQSAVCHFTLHYCADFRYPECDSDECRSAECYDAECHFAKYCLPDCHSAYCHSTLCHLAEHYSENCQSA